MLSMERRRSARSLHLLVEGKLLLSTRDVRQDVGPKKGRGDQSLPAADAVSRFD